MRSIRTWGGARSPEYVLRALPQVLFSVRPERQLVEQIACNLLFRWFVGLGMDVKPCRVLEEPWWVVCWSPPGMLLAVTTNLWNRDSRYLEAIGKH